MKRTDIERLFHAEEPLFEPGALCRELYVVTSGEVRLEPEGRLVGPGAILGEVSALTGRPEAGRAIADGEVSALVLDLPLLQKLCVECPEFSLRLIRHLADRIERVARPATGAESSATAGPEPEAPHGRTRAPATALVARAILDRTRGGEVDGREPVTGRLRELAAACSLDLRATYLEIQSLLESQFVRLADGELLLIDRPSLEEIAGASQD